MVLEKMKSTFRSYNLQYWVVITLELLERGAYYGIMGYFPVHCYNNLGFSGTQYGILYALLVFLLYFIPIIAASLAKKFGYKLILTGAFLMVIPSYILMTFTSSYIAFFPLIIAWGVGAGAFKPMVSATIAHVTKKEQRNSAYSIYYLSINWGSAIAMVGIGLLIPERFAEISFMVGAVLITANLLITILFYKNPITKDKTEKMLDAFRKMALVLSDKKFAILLLIYSGFFFIFSSMHTFLPIYYTNFGIQPENGVNIPFIGANVIITAPLMVAVNPITIITLGPFMSKFMDRFSSLKLMIVGMTLFSFGLLILGFIPVIYAMAFGIFIFSIGEFITHPNFISYVSKIAPHEKVALYMGYAFLPSAAGNVFGSVFGGVLFDKVAVELQMPSLFWAIFVSIGLISIGNFLLYNKWISTKLGTFETKKNFFNSRWSYVGVYSLILIMVLAGFSAGTTTYTGNQVDDDRDKVGPFFEVSETVSFSEYLDEGTSVSFPMDITYPNVIYFNVTLTWTDEPDMQRIIRTYENNPESFRISVEMENISAQSASGSNVHGEEGRIEMDLEFEGKPVFLNNTGSYSVTVELLESGNFVPGVGIIGFTDNGNDFDLMVEYTYLTDQLPQVQEEPE